MSPAPLLALLLVIQTPDGPARAKAAIEKVRAQPSYSTTFKAEIRVPGSDALVLEGEGLWVGGGVLFIQYTSSTGDRKRIVRAGEKTWVYHELSEQWVSAEELGMGGAGRGVQNPDEVLGVLSGHLQGAKAAGHEKIGDKACDVLEITFAGADIEKIMKEQAQQGSFDWKNSSARARALVGSDDLLHRLTSAAELTSADPNTKGQKVVYSAEVTVTAYAAAFLMGYRTEATKTAPAADIFLDPAIYVEIERRPGVRPELVQALAKARETHIARRIDELASGSTEKREAAEYDLRQFGPAARAALTRALESKERADAARRLLAEIGKK